MIKCENLSHVYQKGTPFEKAALKNINLHIRKGELVALIGHTGSGKSTLIQHFNALLAPTDGKIFIDGTDVSLLKKSELIKIRKKVGLVFQYPEHQLMEETVRKDIAFGPSNLRLSKSEIDDRVRNAAISVGIKEELLDKSPFELSGGEKRRVAIAGVLAMEPDVLVLDEPTAGLDPQGRDELLNLIQRLNDCSMTIVFVSHSMEDVANIAKRVIVMNDAQIIMDGKPKDIFARGGELVKIGLNVPEVSRIIAGLRKKGIDISKDIYTVDDALEAVLELYKRKTEIE